MKMHKELETEVNSRVIHDVCNTKSGHYIIPWINWAVKSIAEIGHVWQAEIIVGLRKTECQNEDLQRVAPSFMC